MDIEFIVKRMIDDDREAFNSLMEIYYKKAFRIAYLISGKYADSEDIIQEAFISCYLNRKKIREPEHFERWLYKIVTRTAWSYCKKSKKEQPVDYIFDESLKCDNSFIDDIIKSQESMELYNIIMSLPIKQRTVIILYYYNNMGTKDIAKITSSFEGTVKSRLFSARNSIKKELCKKKPICKKEVPSN